MRAARRRTDRHPGAWLGTAVLCLLAGDLGRADDEIPQADRAPDLPPSPDATSSAREPLDLVLTRSELQSLIRNYELRTGNVLSAPIGEDEVLVIAPAEYAPMREESQDVGGGIVAPFWAIMHPKDAWRILVPIPPKGQPKEEERPVPDPR